MARAALAALVVFCCVFSAHDNDTWWHIRTGELISTARAIPTVDPFSWTIAGKPWFCFEWLSQVLFFAAFKAGAIAGVVGLKTLVAVSAFLIAFPLIEAPAWLAAASLGWAAAVSEAAFLERPIVFDLLLLALLMAARRLSGRRLLLAAVLIEAFWANLHGGAAFLGAAFLAAEGLDRRPRDLLPAAAGLLALGLNPHGFGLLRHALATSLFTERGWVAEWQPMREFANLPGAFLIACAVLLPTAKPKAPFKAAWLLGLLGLSLASKRHLPLFAFMAAPTLAETAARRLGAMPKAALAAILPLFGFYWWGHIHKPWGRSFGFGSYEDLSGAVAFLNKAGIEGRMFNQYDAGGALIGLGRKVFIDSRNVEYGPDFVREAILWKDHWSDLSAKYRFDYAVIFNRRSTYECRALDENPDWTLAYFDDAALVYVRRSSTLNRKALAGAFTRLRPNDPSFDWLDARAGPEIERAVEFSGRSTEALLLKAYLEVRQGRSAKAPIDEAARRPLWNPELIADLARVQEAAGDAKGAAENRRRSAADAAAR